MARGVHAVPFTAVSGVPTGVSGKDPVAIYGVTVTNTNAAAGAVIVRTGGNADGSAGASGQPVAAIAVAGLVSSVPGVADRDWHPGRVANNGIYVEIDGGVTSITGTLWVE